MKRAVVLALLAFILIAQSVSADLVGTERQHRDDRRCAGIARVFRPHGINAHEQRVLDRRHCNAEGKSTRTYQA